MTNPIRNFSMRNINTIGPQLARTESEQSEAASEDYYSFSDRGPSSPSSLAPSMQFRTPDSYAPSPAVSQMNLAQEDLESQRPPTSSTVRFAEDRAHISHISDSIRSNETSRRSPSAYPGRGQTPGLDSSPYVRFAIDQLTEDRARGVQRTDSISTTTTSDYPTDRLIWDEGLGYFTRTRTPIRHDTPPGRPTYTSPSPQALPQRPLSVDPESFMAADAPENSLLYPPLDYLPLVLRPWALALTICCCLALIAGIVFCNIWSRDEEGLWSYLRQGDSRYIVFQFLPQVAATPIIIWSFVIQAAIYRIAPFSIMSAERQKDLVINRLPILSTNFVFPDFSHFRHGEALLGFSLFTIWLSNFFAIPLLSCFFQEKFYIIDGQGVWRWASVQYVGWTLVGLYSILTLGLVMLFVRFLRCWSGLMWDPVSIADLVSIIQRSNILHDFENSETVPSVRESLDPRVLRLGYWKLSSKAEVFYGIGEVNAPVRTPSLHQTGKTPETQSKGLAHVRFDIEQNGAFSNDPNEHHPFSPSARYRWTPWFLRKISILIWTVVVFALFIAFVAVSFINGAIKGGFPPKLPTLPSTTAFSSSNFLYSFIPALIGNVLFLAWQPVDVYIRALQPYAELSSPGGTTAERSILLSYPSSYPLQITIQAIINRHFKVAFVSLMSLLSLGIPILAGGVFIALWFPSHDDIRISAFLPAFYALVGFCGLYAVSFVAIWPGRRRYLPHDITTLADVMSYLYQSPLLSDKILREPRSKTDLVTRLIVAPPSERQLPLYSFGIYVGRDGKEHLGIDRFHRPGRSDMLVTTGNMK
ncbi:phosphoribosylaminoimidazole-succinocarboxamide synthase [Penicillium digitatum]|nr:phosphoribosylaminoimidazole-succinocarboxamide synthase [Penicillium digitatum]